MGRIRDWRRSPFAGAGHLTGYVVQWYLDWGLLSLRNMGVRDMKRFLLLLSIALGAASYADAARALSCDTDVDTFITSKVRLMNSFDPSVFVNPNHANPTPNGDSTNVAKTYRDIFTNAYNLASAEIRTALCKLDYVYVTNDPNHPAWEPVGVWSAKDGSKFIAIPSSMLDTLTNSLSDEENTLNARLFSAKFSSFSDSGAKAAGTGALAVIAHELGHVLFAATNADGSGYSKKPGRPNPNKDACFETAFLGYWDDKVFHSNPQRRWVIFGDQGEPNKNKYKDADIDFAKLKDQIKKGSADMTTTLYQKAGLVSMFAAVAPEEDFVETFKYYVLATANQPPDLSIAGTQTIPNLVSRVITQASTSEMGKKISCERTLLPLM